jgi:hypothetical protein
MSVLEIILSLAFIAVLYALMIHKKTWVRYLGFFIALLSVILLSFGLGVLVKTCGPEPVTWYL